MSLTPLLAAEELVRTTFEWGRIQSNSDWIVPIIACIAILLFVRAMYRRDSVELPTWLGWFLTFLRTTVFLGLLIIYLQPHWRCEREEVRNSRILLLADTSMSMGVNDADAAGAVSRSQQLAATLKESNFLSDLRSIHDVSIFQFGDDLKTDRVITLKKRNASTDSNMAETEPSVEEQQPDWPTILSPTGFETRIGQSLRQLIQSQQGAPVSGVVLLTDGGQNAGIAPDAAVASAQEAKIPIFTVGLGSDRLPANVAVSDFTVPVRAYPGDSYSVTGYLQAQGMAGQTVTVQLLSRPAGGDTTDDNTRIGTGDVLETRQVTLGANGELLPVKFEVAPDVEGHRTLCFRVQAPAEDRNATDNLREADIEIVARKNHVLLLAGGPTREYQFLRSLLHRDHATTLDVLLQSGKPGISQEAGKILDDLPTTREEMFDYDCIVAFDPNWQAFNAAQVELLERWVGEQGGGLIAIAGSAYAGRGVHGWFHDEAMTPIQHLYPVEFPSRLASLDDSVIAGKEPWPLDFTREGLDADFLWLADTSTASREAWSEFSGVYSYCPVRGPKPGATVYARFSDPQTMQSDQKQPVYFAGQFYGAGSVFYMGSGEMWRLRSIDETYFEQFYTKLIRHVSQGRLLRGSSRGVLLVGQERMLLGGTIDVRAQLSNARFEPLDMPNVNLRTVQPDGTIGNVALRADSSRPGSYTARIPALHEGTYRLELLVPESDNERLTRRVQVKTPDLERENPSRNDALLSAIAKETGGKYYIGVNEAFDSRGPNYLGHQFKDCTSTVIRTAAPNPKWEEAWLRWMMIALCSLLCLEWTLRRLMKLA